MILARNLLSALSTPAFLVDVPGQIIFFNDAAGVLFGRRFEETGPISHDDWREAVGPFDEQGASIPFMDLPLTRALRKGVAGHHKHLLRPAAGEQLVEFEVSGVPIVATGGGFRGAMVFFWSSNGSGD
jgi:PAS domain-containing protein